jgi:hypothetical protein
VGKIVYYTILRFALSILILWFAKNHFDEKYFWIMSILGIYLFVFYPAYAAYKKFIDENRKTIEETLCSSCKHFDETAVLCMKYDKHPNETYIPCEGTDWEPK